MNRIVMLTAGQESPCSRDTVLRPMLISEMSPRSTATRTLSEVPQNRIMTIASQKMWWLGGKGAATGAIFLRSNCRRGPCVQKRREQFMLLPEPWGASQRLLRPVISAA